MGKITFRADLDQSASIEALNANKVNLSTYNVSMNDISDRFTKLRDDMEAADATLNDNIGAAIQDLKDNDIANINDALAVINGDKDTEGSIDAKVASAVTAMVDGAPEAYDTLKELLDLINNEDADLNDLITQLNDKVNAVVGDASDSYNTLEKIEASVLAIKADLEEQIAAANADIVAVSNSIPHYKYDSGLGITLDDDDNNCITLSLVPTGDIVGGKATVYSEDDDGNITIESINTIVPSTADDAGAKDYFVESDDDLSEYKCVVEYFYALKDN